MSTESGESIDAFLVRSGELLRCDATVGSATRVAAEDVPPGSTLWRIVRGATEQFTEERVVERDDGFWFEAVPRGFPEDQEADEVLMVGPWPSQRAAVEWHPEVLMVEGGDDVEVDDLAKDVMVEFLHYAEGDLFLPSGLWTSGGDVAMPEGVDPIEAWDNGDDYGAPGGDRLYQLFRFGDLYVALDDSQFVNFGRYNDQDQAVAAWASWYLPEGIASLADEDDEDGEEEEDEDEDDDE
jgi:hypothetical protein